MNENPWKISFLRMFDMANDSHFFHRNPGLDRIPLYEAKMFHFYNHRFANAGEAKGEMKIRGSSERLQLDRLIDPHVFVTPRYYVEKAEVDRKLKTKKKWLMVFRDVTGVVSNERTAIFCIIPRVGTGDKAPIIFSENESVRHISCLLANFCSLTLDFVARQKVGGLKLGYFVVKQLPIVSPDRYSSDDIYFISSRVLELVYTAYDLKHFAEDMGYDGPPFKWDEDRRALLRAELDAYYAKMYGLTRDELRYILDPQDVYGPSFPGETFRVLKEKGIRQYGEYRTRRLVLEAWDRMFGEK